LSKDHFSLSLQAHLGVGAGISPAFPPILWSDVLASASPVSVHESVGAWPHLPSQRQVAPPRPPVIAAAATRFLNFEFSRLRDGCLPRRHRGTFAAGCAGISEAVQKKPRRLDDIALRSPCSPDNSVLKRPKRPESKNALQT
jgi:hypothetical protein